MPIDMQKLIPPPEREPLEREIHDLVYGSLSDIARLLHKDQSLISKAYNPYSDEKHNPVYQFILHLWSMDAIRDDLAGEVLNIVLRERDKWLPVKVTPCNHAHLTRTIMDEFAEFLETELDGRTDDDQLDEITDVIRAAEKKRDAILQRKQARRLERIG